MEYESGYLTGYSDGLNENQRSIDGLTLERDAWKARWKAAVDTADTWAAERDLWMNAYYSLSAGRRVVETHQRLEAE